MNEKKSTKYLKRKDFKHLVLKLYSYLFKLLDFNRKKYLFCDPER